MDDVEIQTFASQNNLDLRLIQKNHLRLTDEYENFILDVYIKKNKKGRIVKNSTLQWKSGKWFTPNSQEELLRLL